MWKCLSCSYINEQWDDRCQRCGVDRVTGEASATQVSDPGPVDVIAPVQVAPAVEAAALPVQQAWVPASPAAPPGLSLPAARKSALDRASLFIILLSLLGLLAIGFVAWQRGMIEIPGLPGPTREPNPQQAVDAAAASLDGMELDPLAELQTSRVKNIKYFRPYIGKLDDVESKLATFAFSNGAVGELSTESLAALEEVYTVGEELIALYREFEAKADKYTNAELEQAKQVLREAFATRFGQLLQLLGSAYSIDLSGVHKAYLLSDQVPAVLKELGRIDPAGAEEKWEQALHARDQYQLDLKYEDIYRQLAARYDALTEMHQQMDAAIKSIPAEKSRAGFLDTNSIALLELYHEIMSKVEESATEYEEYIASLGNIRRSDRMEEYVGQFEELAQQDHLFAFTETYKIYESDRELKHEAYNWLELHFEFARVHWSDLAQSYREVYTYYEDRWAKFWTDGGSGP